MVFYDTSLIIISERIFFIRHNNILCLSSSGFQDQRQLSKGYPQKKMLLFYMLFTDKGIFLHNCDRIVDRSGEKSIVY